MNALMKFEVELPIKLEDRETHYFVSCPILDICTQGPTEGAAKRNIVEVIQLFLESCFDRGVLDEVLKEAGFTVVQKPLPTRGPRSADTVKVPLSLIMDPKRFSDLCPA